MAEAGADLHPFADAEHCASWVGLCPGNHESGGKRLSGKTNKGNRWLRRALVEAAHGAARTKKSYYAALYHRLAGRRGKKRAIVAVAHSLLVAGYHMITQHTEYNDLGHNYFDARNKETVKRRLLKRLAQLGYAAELRPIPATTA